MMYAYIAHATNNTHDAALTKASHHVSRNALSPMKSIFASLLMVLVAFCPAMAETGTALPQSSCASLVNVDLTAIGGVGSRVTGVEETTAQGNDICRVTGELAPSIGFEVALPTNTWTGRYLQVGCGGLCGNVSLRVGAADGCPAYNANGFVVAGTDMGHKGVDGSFTTDSQKREDFAYRAQHLTALAAKKLIEAYYGRAQDYAYFSGCSDGGREALIEAQRYPNDFNGIIAGAPALNFQIQNSLYHGWMALSNRDAEGKAILLASRLPILHEAVLQQCDSLDGQQDGLIANPLACHFDPASIECKPETRDTSHCLTATEVAVAKRYYDGPHDPETGESLTAGQPLFGSELAWADVYVPMQPDQPTMSEKVVLDAVHQIFTDMPDHFRLADLSFTNATFKRLYARHSLNDATDPDLSAFAAAGGKLILWHGWADPHISPLNSIRYHQALLATVGSQRIDDFERLYLFPGMYHCFGGEGPSSFDLLTPMLHWVERGEAPGAVIAHQQPASLQAADLTRDFGLPANMAQQKYNIGHDAKEILQIPLVPSLRMENWRPVYPCPYQASYNGKGDINHSDNYYKEAQTEYFTLPNWVGSIFFTPYH